MEDTLTQNGNALLNDLMNIGCCEELALELIDLEVKAGNLAETEVYQSPEVPHGSRREDI